MIGREDYVPGRYTTTFPAGMTTASFAINILNDTVYEESETFDVVIIRSLLPDNVVASKIYTASVTIIDYGKLLLYKHNPMILIMKYSALMNK